MTKKHNKRVGEPVQVYLAGEDRLLLERLTASLDLSKSEVLRRGLSALGREAVEPSRHPLMAVIGVAGAEGPLGYDPAVEHDRFLADVSDPPQRPVRPPRGRKRAR